MSQTVAPASISKIPLNLTDLSHDRILLKLVHLFASVRDALKRDHKSNLAQLLKNEEDLLLAAPTHPAERYSCVLKKNEELLSMMAAMENQPTSPHVNAVPMSYADATSRKLPERHVLLLKPKTEAPRASRLKPTEMEQFFDKLNTIIPQSDARLHVSEIRPASGKSVLVAIPSAEDSVRARAEL